MFKTYFGNNKNIRILDFLADHIHYSYSLEELTKYTNEYIVYNLKNLVEFNFIIKEGGKYRLNAENDVIKALLKFDFEQGKVKFDKVSREI